MKKVLAPGVEIWKGDCLEILPLLPKGSVKLLLSDPPFGHENEQDDWHASLNEHRGRENRPIANDNLEEMRHIHDAMLVGALSFLDPKNSAIALCHMGGGGKNGPTFAWLANRMDSKGLTFVHPVVWNKKNPGLGWHYRRGYEFIMVGRLEKAEIAWPDKDRAVPNIISLYGGVKGRERLHPNEKPESLMSFFILNHTSPGDLVLDPFMGSGTTGVAALSLGRRFIGIEMDESYFEAASKRLEKALDGRNSSEALMGMFESA